MAWVLALFTSSEAPAVGTFPSTFSMLMTHSYNLVRQIDQWFVVSVFDLIGHLAIFGHRQLPG